MGKVVDFNKYKTKSSKNDNEESISRTIDNSLIRLENSLYILIGIPNSGKSTYADNFLLKHPNIIVIATDEIRNQLTGTYEFSLKSNKSVFDIAKKMINEALVQGFDVVFDATNTNKRYRKTIINIAKRNNAKTIAVVFKTPLGICLDRNSTRSIEIRVPKDVIVEMSKYDSNISESEGFEKVINVPWK